MNTENRYNLFIFIAGLFFIFAACTSKLGKQSLFNGQDFSGWTLFVPGDSVDVSDVWSVKDGVVNCKGVPTGYMRTNKSFSNYKLHVEWRWVEKPGNSGVLLHCQGQDQVWPNCIECQLQSGNAGDFVIIGPGHITVDGKEYVNNERFLVIEKKVNGIEKPAGEWNAYDIICNGDTIKCYVNGTLQNEGTKFFATAGRIALQSEGAPIEFRNIFIDSIK